MIEYDEAFWISQLRDLERYCNAEGYRVVVKPGAAEMVFYDKKLFVLDSKKNDETAMYILLHEIGHTRVISNKRYYETYGCVFDNFSKASMTYKIATIQEELDAWREGLKLADTLGLHVDRRKWEITKTKCIATYLTWAQANKTRIEKRKKLNETSI